MLKKSKPISDSESLFCCGIVGIVGLSNQEGMGVDTCLIGIL